MNNIYFILLCAICSTHNAFAEFTSSAQGLHDPNGQQLFLDPHNHTGGVLTPSAAVDPQKFILGQELSTFDLKDFWQKLVGFYQNSKFKKSRNISNGTKLVLNCDEPTLACSDSINDEQCHNSLLDGISNVLSATPLTGFATAYAFRRSLSDIPDLLGASSNYTQIRAKILEFAITKAGLVELSSSFQNTTIFSKYKEIIEDLKSPQTSAKNRPLKNRIEQLGLKIPEVKWLLLTHTLELGKISDKATLTYDNGQCSSIAMPETLNANPITDLYDTLIKFEDVVGVDVAGPENTCFATEGMRDFKELAQTTYLAAKKRQEIGQKSKKLVVRVHVGEGSPILETPFSEEKNTACEETKKFPEVKRTGSPENLYVHQKESRKNIDFILRTISELKAKYPDIDKFVLFRLGHLTHLTNEQGKLAKNLGVWADANLSSNISTQAWTVDKKIIDTYLVNKGITANKVRSLYSSLIENGAPVGEIFNGHGLKWLLYYKIPTILGSDGSGVEHSPNLANEYKIAEQLIDFWNQTDENFKQQNITIDALLRNQTLHFQEMGY